MPEFDIDFEVETLPRKTLLSDIQKNIFEEAPVLALKSMFPSMAQFLPQTKTEREGYRAIGELSELTQASFKWTVSGMPKEDPQRYEQMSWADVIRESYPMLEDPESRASRSVMAQFGVEMAGNLLELGTRPSTYLIWGAMERFVPPVLKAAFKRLPKSAQNFLLKERFAWGRQPVDSAYSELSRLSGRRITTGSSMTDVDKAWRSAALKWHPDKAPAGQAINYTRNFIKTTGAMDKIKSSRAIQTDVATMLKRPFITKRGEVPLLSKQDFIDAILRARPALKAENLAKLSIPKLTEMAKRLKITPEVKAPTVEDIVKPKEPQYYINAENELISLKPGEKVPETTFSVPEEDAVLLDINYDNPAFYEHLDYLDTIILPEDSKLRIIKQQINTIRGRRLAGKITTDQANASVAKLNKALKVAAKDEKIAFRMTKGGKITLSVRKSGVYVPETFAKYPYFRDEKAVLGGGTDITRAIQGMDGALSVTQKLTLPGQAGQLEQSVLWRTRDTHIAKLDFQRTQAAQLSSIVEGVRADSPEDHLLTELLRNISKEDAYGDALELIKNPKIMWLVSRLSPEKRFQLVEIARKIRLLYDDLITMQNASRQKLNLPDINYMRNYSPEQIRDTSIWDKISQLRKKVDDIMAKKAPLPDYIKPNMPFNPRAQARENGIPYEEQEMSAIKLMERYIVTASKDIYNTAIIQNNKAFITQLRTMGFANSANFLDNWTAEAYAGLKPGLDRLMNLPIKVTGAMRMFNQARNLAVFGWNFGWSIVTQTQSLAFTFARYGTNNTLQGLLEWLKDPNLRKRTAEDYYSYIIKGHKGGRLSRQDVKNLIGEDIQIHKNLGDVLSDMAYFLIYEMEKGLTGSSIRAAELLGQQKGLVGEALRHYASDGGAKTQSMYNDEDKPGVLRPVIMKTLTPFQTYSFEYINTLREWAGKTGTPPDTQAERVWTVLRFMIATALLQGAAYKLAKRKFFLFDIAEMPFPFSEFWWTPIIGVMTGKYMGAGYTLTSPAQTAVDLGQGIRDYLKDGDWFRIRRVLLRYAPGFFGIPGGGMAERFVDASIAYAQGGIRDKRGRLTTPMLDWWDYTKMILFGRRAIRQEKDAFAGEIGFDIGMGFDMDMDFDIGEL